MIKEIIGSKIENPFKLYQCEYNEKGYFLKKGKYKIYYEISGNENGIPVVFVHGGPGATMGELSKRFFDKEKYRIIVIHQRGAGKSLPFAHLENNTTPLLVEDMEDIREKLGIDKWIVFGGSWGSTLSLVYAIMHPNRVIRLVLRGIFLARQEDVDWLFKSGASYFYPKEFDKFLEPLTEDERKDPVSSYMKYLSKDIETAKYYAKHWSDWEMSIVRLIKIENNEEITESNISLARIECLYFTNDSFLPTKNYILKNTDKLDNIQVDIVHGRYDVDCRLIGAYELYKKLKNANLYIIQDAGHASLETGVCHQLMELMK